MTLASLVFLSKCPLKIRSTEQFQAIIFAKRAYRSIAHSRIKLLKSYQCQTQSKLIYDYGCGKFINARSQNSISNLSFIKKGLQKKSYKVKNKHDYSTSVQKSKTGLPPDKNVGKSKVFQAMITFLWPKKDYSMRIKVVIALGLIATSKGLNVLVPFIFKHIIDHLNSFDNTLNMETAATAVITTATALILGYGIARTGASLFSELRLAIIARVAQNSIRKMAYNVFLHIHSLDMNFHLSRQTGALSKAVDRGTRAIKDIINNFVFNLVPTLIELVLVCGVLTFKFGGKYTLITVLCIGSYAAFTLSITTWRTKLRRVMNEADTQLGSKAVDSLINYETVKYFNNENYEADKYDELLKKYADASIKTTTTLAMLNWGQNVILTAGLTATMYMAGLEVMAGNLTVGDLVMVNGLLFQLSVPLNFLGSSYREIEQAKIDMQNMFNILDLKTSVKRVTNAPSLKITPSESDIKFDNVHFEYKPGQKILDGLSFTVQAGKKVAIVGGSGSGKSTIVRLLYRFYDPNQGNIIINNQDISVIDIDSLRYAIGVVPQDCVLFHDTVYHNIHYGDLNTTAEEVYQAAKMAEIHQTITTRFPDKYNTQVGERGLKLSGGEKQRVAIARTILKNPKIIVYDEATSSLDSITEQNILQALSRIAQGRTTIVIAHRLSTVVDADEILVLKDGRVAERGTHYSLLANANSLYTDLWLKQNISLQESIKENEGKTIL